MSEEKKERVDKITLISKKKLAELLKEGKIYFDHDNSKTYPYTPKEEHTGEIRKSMCRKTYEAIWYQKGSNVTHYETLKNHLWIADIFIEKIEKGPKE